MNETNNDEGSCCPICLEPLLLRQTMSTEPSNETLFIGATVPCGHCFHITCWERSFESAARQRRSNIYNCPTCNCKTNSFMRLYLNGPGNVEPTLIPQAETSNPSPSFPVASSTGAHPRPGRSPAQGSPPQQGRRVRSSYNVATPVPATGQVSERFQFGVQGNATSTAAGSNSTGLTSRHRNSNATMAERWVRLLTSTVVLPQTPAASSTRADSSSARSSEQGSPAQQGRRVHFSSTVAPPVPATGQVFQPFQFGVQGSATSTAAGNNSTGVTSPHRNSNATMVQGFVRFGTSTIVLPRTPAASSTSAPSRSERSPARGSPSQQGRRLRRSSTVVPSVPAPSQIFQPFQLGAQGSATTTAAGNNSTGLTSRHRNSNATMAERWVRLGTSTIVLPQSPAASSTRAQSSSGRSPEQGSPAQQGRRVHFSSTVAPPVPATGQVFQPFQFGVQGNATSTAAGDNSTGLTSQTFRFASHETASRASAGNNSTGISSAAASVNPRHEASPRGFTASQPPSAPLSPGPTRTRRVVRARRPQRS